MTAGRRPTLLFLHALPLNGRMWANTAAALTMDAEILAPDLFDLGGSIESWAHAVIEQAGSGELIVIGCSVGGSCALEVARAVPNQVQAIVLVGAKAGVNPDPAMRDEAIELLETHGVAAAWDRYWAPLFGPNTSASTLGTARAWAMEYELATLVNGVRAFHDRRDLDDFAASWTRPLIGIAGTFDTAPSLSVQRALASGPNRSFHVVPDSGHYVNLEQPQMFTRLLDGVVRSLAVS